MKKTAALMSILFFSFHLASAQQRIDWRSLKPEQRKQAIQQMNPQERSALLQQFRENMVVSELDVAESEQEEFKNLYSEYQKKQNEIKSKFKSTENYETLSDEEAKARLNESFDVGQQLLDNRKAYAEKFMKVIKPQQVLHMYQTEGKMRNKMLNRKQDGQRPPSPQRR